MKRQSELKTLKDLEKRYNINSFISVNPIELRKEAIKWVRYWKKDQKLWDGGSRTFKHYQGQIDGFKHFFNIRESELK